VPLSVKQDVLSNSIEVSLFSAIGIMACTDEKLGRPKRRIVSSTTKPFQVTSNGVFMERRGAGWNDERRFCQKKLCFIATDQSVLVRVLSELADRPDCYYMKYSIKPRDGMYLGRCFLLDDQQVGTLWREYKKHPRMMCNVQDDDFTLPFR